MRISPCSSFNFFYFIKKYNIIRKERRKSKKPLEMTQGGIENQGGFVKNVVELRLAEGKVKTVGYFLGPAVPGSFTNGYDVYFMR